MESSSDNETPPEQTKRLRPPKICIPICRHIIRPCFYTMSVWFPILVTLLILIVIFIASYKIIKKNKKKK